eukprot:283613-Amphidinium_carterae.1
MCPPKFQMPGHPSNSDTQGCEELPQASSSLLTTLALGYLGHQCQNTTNGAPSAYGSRQKALPTSAETSSMRNPPRRIGRGSCA